MWFKNLSNFFELIENSFLSKFSSVKGNSDALIQFKLKFDFSKGIVSSSKSIFVPVEPPKEEIKEDSE